MRLHLIPRGNSVLGIEVEYRGPVRMCGSAGDILDGYNPKGDADAALQDLIDTFDTLQRPHWHMIGNHCLYNLPREVRSKALSCRLHGWDRSQRIGMKSTAGRLQRASAAPWKLPESTGNH